MPRIGTLFAASLVLICGMAEAEPPPPQKPEMTRPSRIVPAPAQPDTQRYKQVQQPQALGRQGQVSMEEEEEEAQTRPNPMRGQAGGQSAPMRAPAGAAQQSLGR